MDFSAISKLVRDKNHKLGRTVEIDLEPGLYTSHHFDSVFYGDDRYNELDCAFSVTETVGQIRVYVVPEQEKLMHEALNTLRAKS